MSLANLTEWLKGHPREKSGLPSFSTTLTPLNAPKLTEAQRIEVCRRYATFQSYTSIMHWLREEEHVDISRGRICQIVKEKTWMPLVQRLRKEWAAGVMDIAIAHKRKRLEELERLYDKVERLEVTELTKVRQQLAVLDQVHTEMDERRTDFTNIYFTQIANYTDEELFKRKEELLSKLNRLGGLHGSHQAGTALPAPQGQVAEILNAEATGANGS